MLIFDALLLYNQVLSSPLILTSGWECWVGVIEFVPAPCGEVRLNGNVCGAWGSSAAPAPPG